MWIPRLSDTQPPCYRTLVRAIAHAIECGELQPGARLPPQRRLAWALGWNPSTTQQAYREAARQHLVSGEVGRGTYVLAGSKEQTLFLLRQPDIAMSVIDLRTNVPAIDPADNDAAHALERLQRSGQANCLQRYVSAADLLYARAQGVEWLKGRGLALSLEQILLCAGAQQGLFSVLLSLCQAGETVLVEAFTAPGIKAACAQLRLPMQGVAMDREGILPEDFDRMIRATGARLAVLTPTLQNPTAAVMSDERKQAIARVVRRHRLLVIEDDVYGALTDSPPLHRYIGEYGVLVTSLSKTVAAGLRLGWIVASPELLARIDPHAQSVHWGVSPLCMAIAGEWIRDGTAQRRLAWQRAEVGRRWRLAKKLLGPLLYPTHSPAPHIWLTDSGPESSLADACRLGGVEGAPALVFSAKSPASNALRISLTAADDCRLLKVALERIVQCCGDDKFRSG